jgi:D-arabinose 5-phosphate isomerase GutQ
VSIDISLARRVLQTEAAAILELVGALDGDFKRAVQLLLDCRGRVIVTGIGQSGIICQKIAATFSSTGTAAHFLRRDLVQRRDRSRSTHRTDQAARGSADRDHG